MATEETKKGLRARFRPDFRSKEGAAKLPIYGVGFMMVIQVVATIITGSIAVRADAIHSVLDLISAIIGFMAIKVAARPPDEGHKYGHTKAEDLAGIIIGLLILTVAGTIIYESINRLIYGGEIQMIDVGIWVTVVCVFIPLIMSWWLLRMAKVHDSVALQAEGKHLRADVLSSVAVVVGLVVVNFTGLVILDSIVAMVVALVIAREAVDPLRTALDGIMDKRLPKEEEDAVAQLVGGYSDQIVGMRRLKSRKAGSQRFAEVDVVVPRNLTMAEGHEVGHKLAHELQRKLERSTVTVHTVPCSNTYDQCARCGVDCGIRRKDPAQGPPLPPRRDVMRGTSSLARKD